MPRELAAEHEERQVGAHDRDRQHDALRGAQTGAGQQVAGERVAAEALQQGEQEQRHTDRPVDLPRPPERPREEDPQQVHADRRHEHQRRPVVHPFHHVRVEEERQPHTRRHQHEEAVQRGRGDRQPLVQSGHQALAAPPARGRPPLLGLRHRVLAFRPCWVPHSRCSVSSVARVPRLRAAETAAGRVVNVSEAVAARLRAWGGGAVVRPGARGGVRRPDGLRRRQVHRPSRLLPRSARGGCATAARRAVRRGGGPHAGARRRGRGSDRPAARRRRDASPGGGLRVL